MPSNSLAFLIQFLSVRTAARLNFLINPNIDGSLENSIAIVGCHTNLDLASGGVNDVLAERLGLQEISG